MLVATAERTLANDVTLRQQTMTRRGLHWWELVSIARDKLRTPLTITFAESPPTTTSSSTAAARSSSRRAGDQAARRRQRGRAPGAARAAQFVGGVLLVEAGLPQQGQRRSASGSRQRTRSFEVFYDAATDQVAEFPLRRGAPVDTRSPPRHAGARTRALACPPSLLAAAETQPLPTRATLDAARERRRTARAR